MRRPWMIFTGLALMAATAGAIAQPAKAEATPEQMLAQIEAINTARLQLGRQLAASEACAVIESVKAASDIYAPVAGEVVAANQDASDAPESVNADAYGAWLFKLKPANPDDVGALMDAAGYEAEIAQA